MVLERDNFDDYFNLSENNFCIPLDEEVEEDDENIEFNSKSFIPSKDAAVLHSE